MKKVPLRKCIGCNISKPKNELIRIVKNDEGILIDKTSKLNGRGAYICNSLECFEKMVKTKSLERTFEQKIEQEVLETLTNYFVKKGSIGGNN